MFAEMKLRAANKLPNILAVETAVVDLQYPRDAGNDTLKHAFFAHLKELIQANNGTLTFVDNPRPGDMAMVMAEDFDDALITFGQQHGLSAGEGTAAQKAARLRTHIFGTPKPAAGGSLANTFHALVHARIDGQKLATGHFMTAVGEDDTAQAFIDSMAGNIHANRAGRQMECHVFPIDGDRIMITTPSKHNPAEQHISADQFAHENGKLVGRDRIMLGGFLFFTPAFHAVYDSVIAHLESTPRHKRPQVVLTAAAQAVAATPAYQEKVGRIVTLADTVIHANTGEFRRLLGMDTDWRKPFEADFAGLRGKALEQAKDDHVPYKAAKDAANAAAIAVAIRQAAQLLHEMPDPVRLRYVATNGAREIFVVDAQGCQTFHPAKVARSEIVSTVGAGDNFAAGFQLGDLFQRDTATCVRMGSDFAAAIIKSSDARLNPQRCDTHSGRTLHGALGHLSDATKQAMNRTPDWQNDHDVWPWPPESKPGPTPAP